VYRADQQLLGIAAAAAWVIQACLVVAVVYDVLPSSCVGRCAAGSNAVDAARLQALFYHAQRVSLCFVPVKIVHVLVTNSTQLDYVQVPD